MNRFNPRVVLLECGTTPLDDTYKIEQNGTVFYRKILPFACCAFREGSFYFQPILLEYDFYTYLPEHQNKRTLCYPAREPQFKEIRNLEGRVVRYPVLAFYIVVNRHLYPPKREGENSVEWFSNISGRTRGIAHELLYAEQYAQNYNWEARAPNPTITIPHIDAEAELLCPFETIERLLHTHEQRFGIDLKTREQFEMNESNTIVQSYFRDWLENFAVEPDICYSRTIQYLNTGIRLNCETRIQAALDECKSMHGLKSLSLVEFQKLAQNNAPVYNSYISVCQNDGFSAIDESTIKHLTERYLHKAS